jgi:hypothetical protein
MSDALLLEEEVAAAEIIPEPAVAEPVVAAEQPEPQLEAAGAVETSVSPPAADQRATVLSAVQNARELPPGVRQRLAGLVEQAATLDVSGEPLLATRHVLDLLAQGLPPVLRHDAVGEIERPSHPDGDAFFALSGEDLSDQQAEQIARQQLQRAGLLRSA